MSVSSTTLSQASRERGRVSSVVNERLAVGQSSSGQKAECQSGRIGGLGMEKKRAATRKSLGSSRSQRQAGVNAAGAAAAAAGAHSLMRVKSCICSRMQAVWTRQFDWRIGCWLHQLHACGRIKTAQRGHQRWTGLAKRCQSPRGGPAPAPTRPPWRPACFHFSQSKRAKCRRPRGGFNKGRRSRS